MNLVNPPSRVNKRITFPQTANNILCKQRFRTTGKCGTGNVNTLFYEGINRAIAQGILVGITTKTPEGRAVALYANLGGGAKLVEAGALLLGDLSGQKARLLFMAALSDGRSIAEAQEICKRHAM